MHSPKNALVSEKARKVAASDKRNRGELSRVHIEPAENGYMVISQYEPKSDGRDAVMPDPESMVFNDHKAAAAYVASKLAEHASYESNEK